MTSRTATLPILLAALHKGAVAAVNLAAPGSRISDSLATALDALAGALDEIESGDARCEARERASEARRAFRVVGD